LDKQGIPKKSLPQLYRFCLLMTGDATKAQEIFQATLHEAALRAAQGELPRDPLFLFRDARSRCLEASESGIQPEEIEMEEHEVAAWAPAQIAHLEPGQLAIWISGAPEPQRSALALFYLDQFTNEEILDLLDLKEPQFSHLIAGGRTQFQAWLNATFAHEIPPETHEDSTA
jgi:DNA-directed RNA polymerase specialized sigma24 family protein